MNHNIISRNERLQKVSEALPTLSGHILVVNDTTNALTHIEGTRWSIFSHEKIKGSPNPPTCEGGFDVAVVRLSTNKDQMKMMLSLLNGVLKENAPIWVVGCNDEGIKSFPKTAERFMNDVETIDIRKRARLLNGTRTSETTSFEEWIHNHSIELDGNSVEWKSVPGVFAKGQLDVGTQFLLDVLAAYPIKRTHQLADFACGTGVIARWLADRFPESQLDAMDADSWAMEMTKINAPTATHRLMDGWTGMPRDCRYDLVISNPPVHIGKEQDFTVLEGLIRDVKDRLHYRGQLLMVTQHHIPVQRIATENEYRICEVVEHNKGYKVWRLANHN